MKELWKDIKGYEGIYQVDCIGRIKSLKRNIILKKRIGTKGYSFICIYKDGLPKYYSVHRLVAIAFISNPMNKPCVNHLNGIKDDNRIENLEWVTDSENKIHAFATGLRTDVGENSHYSKLTTDNVINIRRLALSKTHNEIAKMYNVSRVNVTKIINYKTWKYIKGGNKY